MGFGKRAGGVRQHAAQGLSSRLSLWISSSAGGALAQRPAGKSRTRFVTTAFLGLVIGFGGVTAGTTFVHASERAGLLGLFGDLFGQAPPPQPIARVHTPRHYSSLPDARRVSAARWRQHTPRPFAEGYHPRRYRGERIADTALRDGAALRTGRGPLTVCVRTCDGYKFPLGRLGKMQDIAVHQAACAAACPNAQTALFTLPSSQADLDQAVSMKGQPYLAAAWANVYRQKRVQNCSCQPTGVAAAPLAIGSDPTVRVGDVLATENSAQVVTRLALGQVHLADYRSARGLSRGARRNIERQVGALRREVAEADFRRGLRAADARTARVRVAEAGSAHMRAIETGQSFTDMSAPVDAAQAFTPVRIVSPSIYRP